MRYILFFYLLAHYSYVSSQLSIGESKFINKEILFINESIHGLLVAHRLYENYNQEMNKYVDLPKHNLNNLANADIPDNIFSDPDKWFYEKAPIVLYNELLVDPFRSSGIANWSLITAFRNEITMINNDRKKIDLRLKNEDLNSLNTVQAIYGDLESSVRNYEEFRMGVVSFEQNLLSQYHAVNLSPDRKQVYTAVVEMHYEIKKILRNIRMDNQSGTISSYSKLIKEAKWLDQCIAELKSSDEQKGFLIILKIMLEFADDTNEYINKSTIPNEYNLLGKGYYYHNVRMLTRVNRYGNGYVSEMNKLLDRYSWNALHLTEEPHFIKMVYPERIQVENKPEVKESQVSKPTPIKPQEKLHLNVPTGADKIQKTIEVPPPPSAAVIVASHDLKVDTLVFEIELYDHRIKDGDQISINVNGEWVFQHISLEKESRRVIISVHPGVENYIIIKAENEGWRPPNTFGMRYISRGRSENVFVKQDLKTGEGVKINYHL